MAEETGRGEEHIIINTKKVLEALGVNQKDLLIASTWELKYIAYHFKNFFGLNFWANIIERISEFREMLNKHNGQDTIDNELTTNIENKKTANNTIQKLKRGFTIAKLNSKPTIFCKSWQTILREYPEKIHIMGRDGNLNNGIRMKCSEEQIATLEMTLIEYKERQNNTNLDKIKSDVLMDTLGQNSKKSLTSRLYSSYIDRETQNKTNFSTPQKWDKKGFGYSRQNIKQAANLITKLKIPGTYKALLLKHNLSGFIEPKVLNKLGYKTDNECRMCHEKDISYTHLTYDCAVAQFLINQAMLHFQLIYKTKPRIGIHTMNMYIIDHQNFKNQQQKEDYFHLVSIVKITLHKIYQRDEIIHDYTEEKKVLSWYNKVLEDVHLTNKKMKKFHKLRKRLICKEEGRGSESLLSTHIRISRDPFRDFHISQTTNSTTPDEEEIYELLQHMQKSENYKLTEAQKSFLEYSSSRLNNE